MLEIVRVEDRPAACLRGQAIHRVGSPNLGTQAARITTLIVTLPRFAAAMASRSSYSAVPLPNMRGGPWLTKMIVLRPSRRPPR